MKSSDAFLDLTTLAEVNPGWAAGMTILLPIAVLILVAAIGLLCWAIRPANMSSPGARTSATIAAALAFAGWLAFFPTAFVNSDARGDFEPYSRTIEHTLDSDHGWAVGKDDRTPEYRHDPFVEQIADVIRNLDTKGKTFIFNGVKDSQKSTLYVTTNGTSKPTIEFQP